VTILSSEQVAQVLYRAGFRGQALIEMTAIAKRESGNNTNAFNGNRNTGDYSFGLWQINFLGGLGASRLKQFGMSRPEDMYDAQRAANAAFILSGGGSNLSPWGGYKGQANTYNTNMPAAVVAVANAVRSGLVGADWQAKGSAIPIGTKSTSSGISNAPGATASDPYGWAWAAAHPGATASDPYGWAYIAANQTVGGGGGGSVGGGYSTAGTQVNTVSLAGTGSTATAATPFTPPADAQYVRNAAGWGFLFFDLGGATISYMVPPDGSVRVSGTPRLVSDAEWQSINPVDGGMANELESVSKDFGTFKAWWDSIVLNVMGKSNPAANDAGVKRVLAEYAGRPDMSTQELQNRLQGTTWYQGHTQTELQWNNLSAAEQDKQRGDTRARISDLFMQYLGRLPNPGERAVEDYVEQVASGKVGLGQYTEIVKNWALGSPETPWSRQIRDEQEAQRQRPVDIENTTNRVRDLADKWGVQLSNQTLGEWGQGIVEKQKSDQDLLEYLKDQAMVLFPWKDRETDTTTAAQPWLDTYKRTMEKEGSVLTPQVGAALSAGKSAWDFEQDLKKTDDWMGTKNAKETMTGLVDAAGRRFGYA